MIIDEGFLSNAKNIASTQTQNSEANVPVIRRENWEYIIEIILSPREAEKGSPIIHKILSCTIFKEYEIISEEYGKYSYTTSINCDLFITPETVYELIRYITKIITIRVVITFTETDTEKQVIHDLNSDEYKSDDGTEIINHIFKMDLTDKKNMASHIMLFMENMKISKFNIARWFIMNDVSFINYSSDTIIPVRMDSPEYLINKSILHTVKDIHFSFFVYEISEKIIKEIKNSILKSKTNKFIFDCLKNKEQIFLDITTLFPILIKWAGNYQYVYPYFKIDIYELNKDNREEFKYLYDMTEKISSCEIKDFSNHLTSDIVFAEIDKEGNVK